MVRREVGRTHFARISSWILSWVGFCAVEQEYELSKLTDRLQVIPVSKSARKICVNYSGSSAIHIND